MNGADKEEIVTLTASQMAEAMKKGELSSREIVEAELRILKGDFRLVAAFVRLDPGTQGRKFPVVLLDSGQYALKPILSRSGRCRRKQK